MTLTEREMQCLELLCQGISPKQIANQLSISKRTVEIHCRNIRWRLGAVNMVHAAFIAGAERVIISKERFGNTGTYFRPAPIQPLVVTGSHP